MEYKGIIVENVYKSFGKETVLEDVSLSIPPGEIAGVVGNNGSGKTVLMKCICGFLRPDKGSVTVNGIRVGRDRDFPPSLGIIIETPGFIPNMSGYRNLKTLASLRGLIGKREIMAALDRLGLPRQFGIGNFAATRAVLAQSWASLSEIKFVCPKLNLQLPKPKEGQAPGEAYLDLLRSLLKTVGPLAGVFAVTCALIFSVHRYTDLDAARAGVLAQQEILAQAMPQAAVGAETPYHANGALSITAGYSEEGLLLGYCIEVQSQGFGGPITMTVGVDLNGAVTGVAVNSHSETNREGTEAMTPEALERYVGRSGTIRSSGNNSVDSVSGATATSKAITAGVNRALHIVANLSTEGEVQYENTQ